jgi:MOSC domain-containing protein YiiM
VCVPERERNGDRRTLEPMEIVSVNIAAPRTIRWRGRDVLTGIYKAPREGRVAVRTLGLDGDLQADRRVHGGPDKAVYAYPVEHYDYWREWLGVEALPCGAFGENLTTRGFLEDVAFARGRFDAGSASFEVTEPRMPCFKLGLRFGRRDLIRQFAASGRSGFYLRVLREGSVQSGDAIRPLE